MEQARIDLSVTACEPIDWAQIQLPPAWPDQLPMQRPSSLWRLWRIFSGQLREPVKLPAQLPGAERIPKYVLQPFHNLPNGNYSRHFSRGYATGFDRAMLGHMGQGRARLANALSGAQCALDLGCGAGHLAGAMQQAGIAEVWGLEPSPYLLQQAAQRYPGVHLVQGVGEQSGLATGQFDAVGICFVLHEVPPLYLKRILAELRRITVPGARLAVLEPSPKQWFEGVWPMWRAYGWRGVYFRLLARRVHEPFAQAWHQQDFQALLAEYGFELIEQDCGCPFRYFLAQRKADSTD